MVNRVTYMILFTVQLTSKIIQSFKTLHVSGFAKTSFGRSSREVIKWPTEQKHLNNKAPILRKRRFVKSLAPKTACS